MFGASGRANWIMFVAPLVVVVVITADGGCWLGHLFVFFYCFAPFDITDRFFMLFGLLSLLQLLVVCCARCCTFVTSSAL